MRRIVILGGAVLAVVGLGYLAFWGLRAFLVVDGGSALVDGDYERAVPEMRWAANMGDSAAQESMGILYAFGMGVPENDEEAIRWFRRAGPGSEGEVVSDPAASSMYAVGMDYLKGDAGVKRDPAEALKWLTRAAEGGYKPASRQLELLRVQTQ
jgi:TPR repeat protein